MSAVSEEQGRIVDDRLHLLEKQCVIVDEFDAQGFILDVGGGGEGIIGRLKGAQVIAIDSRRVELEEAPEGPLRMVMDARHLAFLDEAFEVVTSFFTLMYVDAADHPRLFKEALRVMAPGGRLLIWGANVPERADEEKDAVVLPLVVELSFARSQGTPSEKVETGYGVSWPDEPLDRRRYVDLARRVGFEVVEEKECGDVFHLALRKA